jgi:hypothetical protein
VRHGWFGNVEFFTHFRHGDLAAGRNLAEKGKLGEAQFGLIKKPRIDTGEFGLDFPELANTGLFFVHGDLLLV